MDVELTHDRWLGATVTVTTYDDEGWSSAAAAWTSSGGYHEAGESLASFLERFLGVGATESDDLARAIEGAITGEWQERGGERREAQLNRWVNATLVGAALTIALAVVGVATTVWLIVRAAS